MNIGPKHLVIGGLVLVAGVGIMLGLGIGTGSEDDQREEAKSQPAGFKGSVLAGTGSEEGQREEAKSQPAGFKGRVLATREHTVGSWLTEPCDPDQRFIDKHYCTDPECVLDKNDMYKGHAAWDFTERQRHWKHMAKDPSHNYETVIDEASHKAKQEPLEWNTVVLAGTQPFAKSRAMGWRLFDNPNDKTLVCGHHDMELPVVVCKKRSPTKKCFLDNTKNCVTFHHPDKEDHIPFHLSPWLMCYTNNGTEYMVNTDDIKKKH